MTARPNASPLRGRYLVQNGAWNAALRATDFVLSATRARAGTKELQKPLERILIAVGGHLGDTVLATTVLPDLAREFPTARVGMLLPSWSRPAIDGHPHFEWIHHVDHWKVNRAQISASEKWRRYRTSATNALSEIEAVRYDLAIDLYAYYPNSARLLARAEIPQRVGFVSGGCGPLYSTAVEWHPQLGHTASQHRELLRHAGCVPGDAPKYDLPPIPTTARDRARQLASGEYVILHPGTGDARKAWPVDRWRETISELTRAGQRVVLTGHGDAEQKLTRELAFNNANAVDLAGQLDWATFRAVIAGAKALIAADSVAAHLSAAAGVPTIAVSAAMSDPEYWRPLGPSVVMLTHPVPCAPCFRSRGCATMNCVRDVTARKVLAVYDQLMARRLTESNAE